MLIDFDELRCACRYMYHDACGFRRTKKEVVCNEGNCPLKEEPTKTVHQRTHGNACLCDSCNGRQVCEWFVDGNGPTVHCAEYGKLNGAG